MAMTKKEQEAMNNITNERDQYKMMLYAVLGIIEVERDVEIPSGMYNVSQGWDFNAYTKEVRQAWSKSHSHGSGIYDEHKTHGSQNGVRLFSTKEKAKQALLNEVKLIHTKELAEVINDKRR